MIWLSRLTQINRTSPELHCLTLFGEAASEKSDRSLFESALEQFYDGKPDPRTLEQLIQASKKAFNAKNCEPLP